MRKASGRLPALNSIMRHPISKRTMTPATALLKPR